MSSKPNSGRFQKGRSGNRKGRPPRAPTPLNPLSQIFFDPIQVNGTDGPCEMSPDQAMKWATFKAACSGRAAAHAQQV